MPGFQFVNFPTESHQPAILVGLEYYRTYSWKLDEIFGARVNNELLDDHVVCQNITAPSYTINREVVMGASLEYKWAKSISWEDVKISFYDTKGFHLYLLEWRRSVWAPDLGINAARDYKKTTQITINTETEVHSWRLVNSWPAAIRHGELTYTNSDVKLVEVTVAYDWAEDPLEQ